MNKQPLFSIITIVLNAEDTLQRAIDSLKNQKFNDFEYIIVDGGSSDNTIEILNKNNDVINILINQKSTGISSAFNCGINHASGRIIGFLNADDWFEKDALMLISNSFMNRKEADGIYCGSTRFITNKSLSFVANSNPDILLKETSVHHSSTFITSSVFKEIGLFSDSYNYAMDYDLFLRALYSEISFFPITDVIANRSLEGVSYKNYRAALKETYTARKPYINNWKNYSTYLIALTKEHLAQLIRNQKIFSGIYQKYWTFKNRTK